MKFVAGVGHARQSSCIMLATALRQQQGKVPSKMLRSRKVNEHTCDAN